MQCNTFISLSSIIIIDLHRKEDKTNLKDSHRLVLGPYKIQKEVKATQNSQAVKKNGAALQSLGEKVVKSKVVVKKWLQ